MARYSTLRVAQAALLDALRRLDELSPRHSWLTPEELEREMTEARAAMTERSQQIRQLGGDPGTVC